MASPEVNMQEMGEVVIVALPETVTEELAAVEDEDKDVLVSSELSPPPGEDVLTVGPMDGDAESSRTDLMSKEDAVMVKLSEEVDVETDVFYPVTCGDSKATLVWKKFVCPGINVKCVQFCEQLISPKEFVCLAGKSTLKDWKRAMRLNGTMLRKIMDSGELDFYQHSKVCSNTCRSTKIDLVGGKVSVGGEQAGDMLSSPLSSPLSSSQLNGAAASFPDGATEETSEWVTAIGEDSVTFWNSLKEAGLLEEVVEEFQKELQEVLKGVEERVCEPPLQVKDAVLLNNIVQNFGMLDLVKKVLASHKNQMDRHREQYTRSLAALEHQCDEHRKRAKELKSKSQHLNNVLMTLTPLPAAAKRPRLTRAASGPASVSAAPTQITLPLSQLTGLPLGKVVTVAGAPAGGGFTLLTSPVIGPEIATEASNLTVVSTGTEAAAGASVPSVPSVPSTAFVKLVGSQFQLVTLPAALQSQAQNAALSPPVGGVSVVAADVPDEDRGVDAMEAELVQVAAEDGQQAAQQH